MAAAFLLVTIAYALGCFTTGYYLAYWRNGLSLNSTANKTNTALELSPWAFVLAFVIDLGKGALAVWSARLFHLPPAWVVACMVAVVAGHIWPAQLSFRGGKAVATLLGTLIAYDYNIFVLLMLAAAILHLTNKNLNLSGLSAVGLISAFGAILRHSWPEVVGLTVLAGIVLQAHREEIREILAEYGYLKNRPEIKRQS